MATDFDYSTEIGGVIAFSEAHHAPARPSKFAYLVYPAKTLRLERREVGPTLTVGYFCLFSIPFLSGFNVNRFPSAIFTAETVRWPSVLLRWLKR